MTVCNMMQVYIYILCTYVVGNRYYLLQGDVEKDLEVLCGLLPSDDKQEVSIC